MEVYIVKGPENSGKSTLINQVLIGALSNGWEYENLIGTVSNMGGTTNRAVPDNFGILTKKSASTEQDKNKSSEDIAILSAGDDWNDIKTCLDEIQKHQKVEKIILAAREPYSKKANILANIKQYYLTTPGNTINEFEIFYFNQILKTVGL